MSIDLNADVGEGCDDEALLPFLTSANVACGMHAGTPGLMDRTVALALARGIRVGAHPGYADRENFGRIEIDLPLEDVENLVLYQVAALDGFVRSRGGRLAHVKAHGALYNRAARELDLARAIARGVRRHGQDLVLVGLAGSKLLTAAEEVGIPAAGEAFVDRRYLPNGSLMPRKQAGSVLTDPAEAAEQAVHIARDGYVTASDGSRLPVAARTLCLHGDTPGAPRIAHAVRERLERDGVRVLPLG
ncbi:MAG TPA: 5-oxoprolinase subunit PxpA [Myxococcales bacterium]|nr:5-oxoprolinase subunit PxpA [Myxococcales bacterium]